MFQRFGRAVGRDRSQHSTEVDRRSPTCAHGGRTPHPWLVQRGDKTVGTTQRLKKVEGEHA